MASIHSMSSSEFQDEFIEELIERYLEKYPKDENGLHVKMIRLEVEATK